ncbi:beta-ketoacyl [acyl carrier protein] synthase domain-containing protein [Burkholderia thailandensis]|uniref:beta-ketoacyl [acyl carrier protein] synthase domain-containing protein n=1 Tax=Burkholderia thailandensis TaxID=57975 RepID=UPI00016A6EAF|nr:polyketide synthase [Burkholderia thailandensis]AOJ48171.1 peptide synthase [Burkholderia thailandensis]AVR06218.1 polyketide synthase [Burkholderia thailandensis]AWY62307.1 polyketide synthase [Burkholderia thailandensis]AWY64348.1 polyketide synthase [Burkholderia thailandensis]KVG21671.1 peptide synthase [Burkholderia thailandensis]
MTHSHSDVGARPSGAPEGRPMDIAIVGVSARVPGARDVDALWSLLMSGGDGLTTFEPHELAAELAPLGDAERARYVPRRGVLDGIEACDAGFFNLSAAEATLLDPQHRVLMELVWEALEDAGAADCAGRNVGVFTTSGLSHYLIKHLLPDPAISERHGQLQLLMLNDKDFLATRIAYFLNVHGPAVNVQTGCSSSLVALHYACLSLLRRDCEMAVVGGVSIALPQQAGYVFSENMIGSRDGFCRAFDSDASGTVRGNGACAVVLKPLAEALADRDPVWAVIKGTALNNDGRDKVGFTAPSPKWQADVIDAVYRRSGVALDDVDFVEAHGTGTPLGDPIEARAINQVFARAGARRPRYLGALKTQIGHLDTAAGLAGLIKLCVALRNGTIPPTAHFRTLNPRISLDDSQFTINTEPVAWPRRDAPRYAALSSFGIGGTNAHVVVADAPAGERAPAAGSAASVESAESGPHLIVVSAKSAASLDALRNAYADAIAALDDAALADFAYSTRVGRRGFEHRLAVCADGRADAVEQLRAARARFTAKTVEGVSVAAADAPSIAARLGIASPERAERPVEAIAARLAELGVAIDAGAAVRLGIADGRLHVVTPDAWSEAIDAATPDATGRHLQAALWRAGVAVDFGRDTGSAARRRIRIPTYRFDRQRHWIDAPCSRHGDGRDSQSAGDAAPDARRRMPPAEQPTSLVALEAALLSHWRGLLGLPTLRSTDNVFEQGADSLTVAQFVAQLTSERALPVHVVDCYSEPSVGGQARLVGARIGLGGPAAAAAQASAPAPEVERFDNL